jgi:uncharacterized protein YrrD
MIIQRYGEERYRSIIVLGVPIERRWNRECQVRKEEPDMRIADLRDTPVLSVASGTKLGAVHDFLLDDTYLQIAALVIGGGGLFGGHKQAVAYSSIHGIGPDAVMVNGLDAVQEMGEASPLGKAHPFDAIRQQVMSESGVSLGRVVETDFEPQTGAMSSLSFSALDGPGPEGSDVCDVERADIVSMTKTMVIVRHSVVGQTDEDLALEPQDRGELVGRGPGGGADRDVTAGEPGATDFQPATTVART